VSRTAFDGPAAADEVRRLVTRMATVLRSVDLAVAIAATPLRRVRNMNLLRFNAEASLGPARGIFRRKAAYGRSGAVAILPMLPKGPKGRTYSECLTDVASDHGCEGLICWCRYADGCWICNSNPPLDCAWDDQYRGRPEKPLGGVFDPARSRRSPSHRSLPYTRRCDGRVGHSPGDQSVAVRGPAGRTMSALRSSPLLGANRMTLPRCAASVRAEDRGLGPRRPSRRKLAPF
jgi:hypothetical protein